MAYWLRAGVAAASKSANVEALAQFSRGLELLEALSDPRERAERELDLQMSLGPALFATKSYSHPDVGRTYARAGELCRQLGYHSREFTALRGLMLHHLNHSSWRSPGILPRRRCVWPNGLAMRPVSSGGTWRSPRRCSGKGSSSRRLRTSGGASRCSIRTCSSRIGRVHTPACNANSTSRRFPGCSVTRIGPSMS